MDNSRQVEPTSSTPVMMKEEDRLLEVQDLKMHFPILRGVMGRVKGYTKAVDGINFFIRKGETLGLVGESGCGKTTVGRCIVRAYEPTAGQVLYRDADDSVVDLLQLDKLTFRSYLTGIRMIFQDPYSSLNPRMTVFEIISEALKVNKMGTQSEMEARAEYLLQRVGLRPEYMQRYPHAFSGGERQRIGVARSLVTNPRLIIADEAVSALDVSIRAQILNLMEELQRDFDLTYLFISHDLSVIRHICDRVVVMYVGKVVEVADGLNLYVNPKHPYTEALMSAVPQADPRTARAKQRIMLEGDVADPANPPGGCYFHPRCRYAKDVCSDEELELRDLGDGHCVACHFAEELDLWGVMVVGASKRT